MDLHLGALQGLIVFLQCDLKACFPFYLFLTSSLIFSP